MVVRFDDYIERLRCSLENTAEYIHNTCNCDEEIYNKVISFFNHLKREDEFFYMQLIGLLVSDHYKYLYDRSLFGNLNNEEKAMISLYNDLNSNEDVVDLIEKNPDIITELLYHMSEYNALDYFEKREILINNKDNMKKLVKFSYLNVFGYLYYCQKYTLETFQTIYENAINNGESDDVLIFNLACTLEEVYSTNEDEYFSLISELLETYYMIGKYVLSSKKDINQESVLRDTISFLENSNVEEILKKIKVIYDYEKRQINETLNEMFKRCMEYHDEFKTDSDDLSYKTIQKLKSIKEL